MIIAAILVVGALLVGIVSGLLIGKHVRPGKRTRWLVVALVLFSIGLLLTLADSNTLQYKWAERSWPSVTGKVLHSELTNGNAFSPSITYEYSVADSTYSGASDGRAPGFGGKRRRYDAAETILHEYAPGSEITIHYNPEHPDDSTLRPGPDWDVFVQLSFGTLLMMCGAALLLLLKSSAARARGMRGRGL